MVRGFMGSRVQGFRGSGVQGLRGSGVQGLKASGFRRLAAWGGSGIRPLDTMPKPTPRHPRTLLEGAGDLVSCL